MEAQKPGGKLRIRRRTSILPWFVLLCGILATGLGTYVLSEYLRVRNQRRFEEAIAQVQDTLETRIEAYIGLLRGGSGLFAANPFVTLDQFRAFCQRLRIQSHYPGAQGYGYSVRFTPDKLEAITQTMHRQGVTNFQIWPQGLRNEYHSTIYLEPQNAANQKALGYDMSTEPVRRAAMQKACDSGDAVISEKISFLDQSRQPNQVGFVLYVPVYTGGTVPATVPERREKLQGFVYSPFRSGDLLTQIMGPHFSTPIRVEIYDGKEPTPEKLMTVFGPKPKKRGQVQSSQLLLAGHPWSLVFEADRDFVRGYGDEFLFVVPALGILATLALFYFTRAEGVARASSQSAATELFKQREWLQVTLSSIGDGVITTDINGRIEFMNAVAETLTGWSTSEARGKALPEIFDILNEESRQVLENPAMKVLKSGAVVNLPNHSLLIGRTGLERSIDDSAAPIRDRSGRLVGVVLVFREITERRKYERRITAQHAITGVLAESPALSIAAGRVLEAICENLGFDLGIFWLIKPGQEHAESYRIWHLPNLPLEAFDHASKSFKPKPGDGLPGRVWAGGEPAWIPDFQTESSFPRAPAARESGLHAALAFPIKTENRLFGILEFLSHAITVPDQELLHVVKGIGLQIGQFIERKEAEKALQESEELYRTIAETAADGIITIDGDSTILEVNTAIEKIFGYSRSELLGQKLPKLMPTRMGDAHRTGMARFLATGQKRMSWHSVELPGRHKEGREIPLEISFGMTIRGKEHLFVGLVRDITERKRSAAKLRESEERFAILVDQAEEYAIITTDSTGMVSTWNAGAERIFGYSESEILGKKLITLFTPEDRESNVPGQEMQVARAEGQSTDERWLLRKDGSRFWASGSLLQLRQEDGTVRGFAKILRDMTQRKQAEEAIRNLNQQLEERVQRRTAALQESKEQMEAFMYTVAHDLRAPLRAMQGFSQALLEDYQSRLDEQARDFMRRIRASSEKMDQLIQDLLSFSQLSRSDLNFTPVKIQEAVEKAIQTFADALAQTGAQISVQTDNIFVQAHAPTLEHVFENLLSNALKFTRPGQKPLIGIRAFEHADIVKISIQDNGIGISPEYHERIFGVFERLHGQEAYPGTGIGLAIVKKGVERMGGKVGVSSEPGEGSVFWIELPKPPR
jgi:PAS domain S-box-containing protein